MSNKEKSNFKKLWLPLFVFWVVLILFYKFIDKMPSVFNSIFSFVGIIAPFILGIVIAFVLYKPVFHLEKLIKKTKNNFLKKHSRGISVLFNYLGLIVILFVTLYLILPKLFSSIASLINNLPEYYNSLTEYIKQLAGEDNKILGFDITNIYKEIDISKILSFFDITVVAKYAEEVFKATGVVIDLVMAFVVSVYALLGREHLFKVSEKLLSMVLTDNKIANFKRFMHRTSGIFYSYIYSQMIDAVIVTALCFIVFAIIGVPYTLLLAVLMGLCNLIPYFGCWIGGAVVVLATLLSTGNFALAIIALVTIIAIQQLDANIIQPRIVADSLGLKPIYVLLAIMIGSGLFGFIGIILSVPIMAVIRMVVLDYMENLGDNKTIFVKKQTESEDQK